jgi:hypothetical protein
MKKQLLIVGLALVAGLFSCKKDEIKPSTTPLKTTYTIDLEEVSLPKSGYLDSLVGGVLLSKDFQFLNKFDEKYHYWSGGFSVSNVVNVETAGSKNMYASFAGSGAEKSKQYLVSTNNSVIKLPSSIQLISMAITNSTYAALSMKNGDSFAKKFSGKDKDFFKVWVKGYASGKVKDSLEVYLANFQLTDTTQNFIQKEWKTIDLSKFVAIDSLSFKLESTDVGQWGMNTPGYFTVDNIKFTK